MSPVIPLWLGFCGCGGVWFLLDWYSWAHRQWFSWLNVKEYPAATILQEDLFCLHFPFQFWVGWATYCCPACRGINWHIHAPALLFTTQTVLSPGGKTSAGYTSRGFISRAKVKAIKYSFVIILGEWKALHLVGGEDADVRKLVFLSSLHHQQIKCSRWLRGALLRPPDLVLPLSSAW